MNDGCVVAVYESLARAELAIRALRRADFAERQMSLVTSSRLNLPEVAEQLALGEDSLRDAAVGAGLGGLLGIMAGIGAIAISGVGAVFALGPFAAGLTGATVGAYFGSLVGWGVHRQQTERYERYVSDGKLLVIVNGDPAELDDAERVMRETDTTDVRLYVQTCSESPELLAHRAKTRPEQRRIFSTDQFYEMEESRWL